ncbi:glycosyltransferase family 4 protein [Cryobacterium sp. 1639]|uniref:glycosyltransferase family 4 protein n=1 Tax=Cryobacterium inferilacus TaxID=2866629 RepID=UPI001C730434|nr:glycosyltransferase family 1 protein [Cryobacterium sp. 1639]MBX0301732.1 glycosyltransferase family 4 protein [Cryobacterium sp. 1639]
MKVLFPERIISKHVGGNTTYAREIKDGLTARGVDTGLMRSASKPALTMVRETLIGLRSRPGEVLHYSADTGPLLRTRTRSVVTVHGVASRWIDVARTSAQESTWRFRVDRAIKCTDRILTVSQSAANDIENVFSVDRSRISVIPHGIDSQSFQREVLLSDAIRGQLPAAFALYLGNVEPRKNLIQLVRAFQTGDLATAGLPLVIAGRPAWNFSEAMTEIESASNVIYLGFVSDNDRVALMQRCSVFVFPSLYEGFGLPVLEAMAAGVPVVSSRRGSLAEVAGPSYEIQELDAQGISVAISSAMSDSEWVAGAKQAGQEWAARFRWADSIDAHLKVYKEVLFS